MIRVANTFLNVPAIAPRMEPTATASPLRELTTGLARGDDAAWMEFHRTFGPRIFRHLLAATHGEYDLASEALQQTYLRVARHARPCESEPMFLGWLRIVARSALNDCRRRRRSFWELLRRRADDASGDEAEHESDDRLQLALDVALARLEPEDRSLLEAKYLSGRPVRTIAEQLSVSPKAIESRLTRARAELRRTLLNALARHD